MAIFDINALDGGVVTANVTAAVTGATRIEEALTGRETFPYFEGTCAD